MIIIEKEMPDIAVHTNNELKKKEKKTHTHEYK
jgi:hypothetical protein